MTLAEFLITRLDEDATLAQWIVDRDAWRGIHVDSATEVASHVNRHGPARVLADVAAKRAVLAELDRWDHADLCCYDCEDDCPTAGCDCGLDDRRQDPQAVRAALR